MKVFKVTINGSSLISADANHLLCELECQLEHLEKGDETEIEVTLSSEEMTDEQYADLPEFDGF